MTTCCVAPHVYERPQLSVSAVSSLPWIDRARLYGIALCTADARVHTDVSNGRHSVDSSMRGAVVREGRVAGQLQLTGLGGIGDQLSCRA